jgi:hypothetical protein
VEDLSKHNKNSFLLGQFISNRPDTINHKQISSQACLSKVHKKLNDLCSESALHSKQLAGSGLYGAH